MLYKLLYKICLLILKISVLIVAVLGGVSIGVIKQPGEESVPSTHNSRVTLHPSLREDWPWGHAAHLPFSHASPGMALPTVSWALPHQWLIKTVHPRLSHRLVWWRHPLSWGSSSQVMLVSDWHPNQCTSCWCQTKSQQKSQQAFYYAVNVHWFIFHSTLLLSFETRKG